MTDQRNSSSMDLELKEDLEKWDLYKTLFEEHALNKKTYQALADENGLSRNTVKKYIAIYRERLTTELLALGREHLGEIYTKLEWLFDEAKKSWEGGNRDVALLNLIRSVIKDQAALFQTDKNKSNEDSDPLLMVMDDSAYREAERKHEEAKKDLSTIEGTYKVDDNKNTQDIV